MERAQIKVKLHGTADCAGRISHDIEWSLDGRIGMQTYFADPAETVKRLRHNIADQFWFHRRRSRLMRP